MGKLTSRKHSDLKIAALEWLEARGFKDIELEVTILYNSEGNHRRKFMIDVVGRRKGKKVAVECGGSLNNKLDTLLGLFHEVYVLPYGREEPVKWKKGSEICHCCGNALSSVSFSQHGLYDTRRSSDGLWRTTRCG